MKQAILNKNTTIENDTYYKLADKNLVIDLCDTTKFFDRRACLCKSDENEFFLDVAFLIEGKKNVTLDFCGATVTLNGIIQPFLIIDSENVTVKNVVVEYSRGVVSEMTVLETGKGFFKTVIGENFPCEFIDGDLIAQGKTWVGKKLSTQPQFFQAFNGETHKGAGIYLVAAGKNIKIDETLPWAKDTYRLNIYKEGEVYTFSGKTVPNYHKGDIVEFTSYNRKTSSIYSVCSENIFIENYRIINGIGMGICPIKTKNIFIDGLKLFYDEKSKGVVTNAADAIHAVACGGDFIIKNSVIEGMVDDAINIHSHFYIVDKANKNELILNSRAVTSQYAPVIGENDNIAVYRDFTLEQKYSANVKDVKYLGGGKIKLILNEEIQSVKEGDLVENLSSQPNITLKNCKIGKANSHLRFQSRGKILIQDCECELLLMLTGDTNYWFESSPCTDITIDNVKFTDDEGCIMAEPVFTDTEKEPFYHKNITVKNCQFTRDMQAVFRFADNITFINNKNVNNTGMKIKLFNCGKNVTVDKDVVIERSNERIEKAY